MTNGQRSGTLQSVLPDGRRFVAWWALLTTLGLVVGAPIGAVVEAAIRRSWYRFDMSVAEQMFKQGVNVGAMLAVWGALMGAAQWTLLRRLNGAVLWAPATAAGWGLAGIVGGAVGAAFSLVTPDGTVNGPSAASVVLGFVPFFLATGVFQWLWLRQRVDRAARWLPASAVAFCLGGVTAFAVVRGTLVAAGWLTEYDFPSVKVFVLLAVVMGPIIGTVSGAVMVRLLRRPASAQ